MVAAYGDVVVNVCVAWQQRKAYGSVMAISMAKAAKISRKEEIISIESEERRKKWPSAKAAYQQLAVATV